jgi:hypothetical protein
LFLLLALGALEQLADEHVGWQVFGCVLEAMSAAELEPELFCVQPNVPKALNVGHYFTLQPLRSHLSLAFLSRAELLFMLVSIYLQMRDGVQLRCNHSGDSRGLTPK